MMKNVGGFRFRCLKDKGSQYFACGKQLRDCWLMGIGCVVCNLIYTNFQNFLEICCNAGNKGVLDNSLE